MSTKKTSICITEGQVYVLGDTGSEVSKDEVFRQIILGTFNYYYENYPNKSVGTLMKVVMQNFMKNTCKQVEIDFSNTKLSGLKEVLSTGDGNSEKLFFLLYVFSFLSSEYGEDKTEELFSDFFNVDAKVFTQMQEIMNLPLQKTNVVQS